jgi:4-hydroxybenzoate polyprenyltransferase
MTSTLRISEATRVMLVLGRVSNLPTVWSNCLAGWVLAGGGIQNELLVFCAGATFLYLGGMFLNDAFDTDFDRRHRPERPIVSGQIGAMSRGCTRRSTAIT